MQRTEQIVRSKYFHGFLGRLHSGPSWGARRARQHRQAEPRRDPNRGTRPGGGRVCRARRPAITVGSFVATSGQKAWPSAGSFVATYGQFSWPPTTLNWDTPAERLNTMLHTAA